MYFVNIALITRISIYLARLGRTTAGTCPDGLFFGNIALITELISINYHN